MFLLLRRWEVRLTVCVTLFALLTVAASTSLKAEDLSRWIRVAQAPARDPNGETIPTPQRQANECPALEELGYRAKSLSELSLDVAVRDERLPADCSSELFGRTTFGHDGRSWYATEFNWEASDLFAQPAYFDMPMLERYGQTRHPLVQPWISGAHFFSQFPLLPYKVLVDHPRDRVYTLGYQRSGTPW